jgi:hypothetical protein
MRYATWEVNFIDDEKNGLTPEPIIRSRGGEAEGLFFAEERKIVGWFSDDANIDGLENYSFEEITPESALQLALIIDPSAYTNANGIISFQIKEIE